MSGLRMDCVYAKADGLSYFGEIVLTLQPFPRKPSAISAWSGLLPANGWMVFHMAAGGSRDWHVNPEPAVSVLLSGEILTEVGGAGGVKRVTRAGSINLSLDATGQGHRTRVVGAQDAYGMALKIPPADLRAFLASIEGLPADAILPTEV
jgi:hypothetical protein